jgi:hypothetical protein
MCQSNTNPFTIISYSVSVNFANILMMLFQMAAVSVVPAILDYVCDDVIRNELLPRARNVYTSNGADVKIVLSLLACIAKVIFLT